MILHVTHNRTAKWIDTGWVVTDAPSFYWQGQGKQSPMFTEFKEALAWIIKHDEEKK